jgi:hypothetical protein
MEKKDIEKLLLAGQRIQINPIGYSMYPMFTSVTDSAIVDPVSTSLLKRGDVVLYRRPDGPLVLHRIYKRTRAGYYLLGDGQAVLEGPLPHDQMRGKLVTFIRKGRTISVKNPIYRLAASVWLILLPIRKPIQAFLMFMKRKVFRRT